MKQVLRIASQPLRAMLRVPGSKSITNRAILLAALANRVSEISEILISDDTKALIEALRQLGIVIMLDEKARLCIVEGCGGVISKAESTVWCAEAGTVARFLPPVCAASPSVVHFDGGERLRERPLKELLAILRTQGATFEPAVCERMPFTMTGVPGLRGGDITVDAQATGQYVSGLLMAAPLANEAVRIKASQLVSKPYVQMTCAMMAEFGVQVQCLADDVFAVAASQRYQSRDYIVEPDLSTASYFFAAAAVTGGQVTVQGVSRKQTLQGDVAFLSVLEAMGCCVQDGVDGVTVIGSDSLRGVTVDMRDYSDTFMTLAALAPFASSPTTITNIKHTRSQESDRITAVSEGLSRLDVKVEASESGLTIYPGMPKGGMVDSYQDHRIAMAFAIIGLRVSGVEIEGADCVSKTCPEFFTLWDQLFS